MYPDLILYFCPNGLGLAWLRTGNTSANLSSSLHESNGDEKQLRVPTTILEDEATRASTDKASLGQK